MASFDDVLDYINEKTDVSARCYHSEFQGQYYVEFEYYSQLEEDVIEDVWFKNKTAAEFLNALKDTLEDYKDRCEDTLELYVRERPRGAEGFSVRELLEDADWKVEFWTKFVNEIADKFDTNKEEK